MRKAGTIAFTATFAGLLAAIAVWLRRRKKAKSSSMRRQRKKAS